MVDKVVYLTQSGLQKLEAELDYLKHVKYPAMLAQMQDTTAGGYTIDNTEYITAHVDVSMLEARIVELSQTLAYAQIITPNTTSSGIGLGSTVVVQEEGCEPETYTIVGPAEANPDEGYISNESPFGRALLNHMRGEEVTVVTPGGELIFRILDVQ